jgi:hypothetical protein
MDLGPHSLHIYLSVIVVLAAAVVALVCDLLKGRNEQLRELAVELQIRHEEAERRIHIMEKKAARIPNLRSIKPTAAVAATPAHAPAQISSAPSQIHVPAMGPEPIPEPVKTPRPKVAAISAQPDRQTRPERRQREMSPAVAAVAEAAASIVNNNKEHQRAFAAAASMSSSSDRASARAESPASLTGASTVTASGGRKNWDSLLRKSATQQQTGSVIPFESIRDAVPAGFHDPSVLQRAVESNRTVSGLIVSIGTNNLSKSGSDEISDFFKTLLEPQDFGCQSGSDEYVMICGGEQAASAQRRLSEIAEKLWDFQLRSIGGLSVQFSWGSSEARGERIGEAVATAIEQMQETRQSRRVNIARAV